MNKVSADFLLLSCYLHRRHIKWIEELEQIFIEHLNGTCEGEYELLLGMSDNADKNIRCGPA